MELVSIYFTSLLLKYQCGKRGFFLIGFGYEGNLLGECKIFKMGA